MNCVLGWSVQGEKVGRIYLQALISYWLMAYFTRYKQGFPDDSDGKESACNVGDLGSIPGLGRSPGVPTLVFLPGESHGQRSLAGYSP